jgi:hypothetical protein
MWHGLYLAVPYKKKICVWKSKNERRRKLENRRKVYRMKV